MGLQGQTFPGWDITDAVRNFTLTPTVRDTVPVCTLLTGRLPDSMCPVAAAESGTTTRYVVLWEYWTQSIAPNREISAWLFHAFGPPGKSHSPGCVGGSAGGSWPNWSWCWRHCCPQQRPGGPPGSVGKRGARGMPKRPQWEAGGTLTRHPASNLERDDLG